MMLGAMGSLLNVLVVQGNPTKVTNGVRHRTSGPLQTPQKLESHALDPPYTQLLSHLLNTHLDSFFSQRMWTKYRLGL